MTDINSATVTAPARGQGEVILDLQNWKIKGERALAWQTR